MNLKLLAVVIKREIITLKLKILMKLNMNRFLIFSKIHCLVQMRKRKKDINYHFGLIMINLIWKKMFAVNFRKKIE